MAHLNSEGGITVPSEELDTLRFLLLNADSHLMSKKIHTDIDKKSMNLSSDLAHLIYKRRKHNGKLE